MCLASAGAVGVLAVAGGAYSVYAHNARASGARLPTPLIVLAPAKQTSLGTAKFRYTDSGGPGVSFQCSLDRVPFKACAKHPGLPGPVGRGKHVYSGLSLGPHVFRVRVIGSAGAPSRAAHYSWLVVAPAGSTGQVPARSGPAQPDPTQPGPAKPGPVPPRPEGFFISAREGALLPLYPGAPPQAIPLTLTNPADFAIFVTSVTVAVSSSPLGCDSATNLRFAQSDVSGAAPVKVPPHGSVTLPTQGRSAPSIQLLDLPVNQDACQNAQFPLNLTGTSHT
jgi:hypothetical protein